MMFNAMDPGTMTNKTEFIAKLTYAISVIIASSS